MHERPGDDGDKQTFFPSFQAAEGQQLAAIVVSSTMSSALAVAECALDAKVPVIIAPALYCYLGPGR